MKTIFFIAVLLLCILGCTSQQTEQLTQQQKEQIKSEVKAVVDSIIARWVRLDAEGAMQYFSPEFVNVGDTSLIDYQTYKDGWNNFNKSIATATVTPIYMDFIVLSKELVISTFIVKAEYLLKSGEKMTFNRLKYTDVYKKVNGQWKDIYDISSGTSVIQAAEKK